MNIVVTKKIDIELSEHEKRAIDTVEEIRDLICDVYERCIDCPLHRYNSEEDAVCSLDFNPINNLF